MATKTWNGSDTSWNTAGNWSPSGVPGSGDDVVFDATSTNNCTLDVDAQTIASLDVQSGYTGALYFADSAYSFAVSGNVTFAGGSGGSLDPGDSTFTCSGDFDNSAQTGWTIPGGTAIFDGTGTFASSNEQLRDVELSGTTTFANVARLIGDVTISGTASGIGYISCYADVVVTGTGSCSVQVRLTNVASFTVQSGGSYSDPELMFQGLGPFEIQGDINANLVPFATGGTQEVRFTGNTKFTGIDLQFASSVQTFVTNSHDVEITGDVALDANAAWSQGTGTITLSGTANQSIDFNGESVEDIDIDKSAGTVTLAGAVDTDSLTLTDGTLDIDGQALDITGNFTMAAGTVVNDTAATGSVSIGGNLDINGISGTTCTWSDADIDQITGTGDADWATVSNSNNSSGTTIDATDNCTDSGGNTGWNFAAGLAIPIAMHHYTQMRGMA